MPFPSRPMAAAIFRVSRPGRTTAASAPAVPVT